MIRELNFRFNPRRTEDIFVTDNSSAWRVATLIIGDDTCAKCVGHFTVYTGKGRAYFVELDDHIEAVSPEGELFNIWFADTVRDRHDTIRRLLNIPDVMVCSEPDENPVGSLHHCPKD